MVVVGRWWFLVKNPKVILMCGSQLPLALGFACFWGAHSWQAELKACLGALIFLEIHEQCLRFCYWLLELSPGRQESFQSMCLLLPSSQKQVKTCWFFGPIPWVVKINKRIKKKWWWWGGGGFW